MNNKKIVHQVTKKYMIMNRKRTILAIIGISLMVTLMTCVLIGKDTVYRYFTDIAAKKNGNWHISVYNLDNQKLQKLKKVTAIKEVALTEDLKYTDFEASGNDEKPFLNIRRYSPDALKLMNIKPVMGRLPQNENEIVISRSAIKEGADIKIGDKISAKTYERYIHNNMTSGEFVIKQPRIVIPAGETVKLPFDMYYYVPGTAFGDDFYKNAEEIHKETGFTAEYTITGFIDPPAFEESYYAWYAAISLMGDTPALKSGYNALVMTDTKKITEETWTGVRNIVGTDNYETNDEVLAFAGETEYNSINKLVFMAQCFFVGLIMIISIILIYNVFNLSFDERTRYLGMLSSVGATGRQKRSSVYYEAGLMILMAFPIGLLFGMLIVKAGVGVVRPIAEIFFSVKGGDYVNIPAKLCLKPVGVLVTILISIGTVYISALLPAWKISKIGPIESIRGNVSKKRRHRTQKSIISGNPEMLLSGRFITNDRIKSRSITRAIAVFLIASIVVCYGANVFLQMMDYKLEDYDLSDVAYKGSDNWITVRDSGEVYDEDGNVLNVEKPDRETILSEIERLDVKNLHVNYSDFMAGRVNYEVYSDEFLKKMYEVYSLYFPEGELKYDDFLESMFSNEIKSGIADEFIQVMSYDEETFAKLCKKVSAANYDNIDFPCVIVNYANISTDSIRPEEGKPRDYKYYEIDDAVRYNVGDTLEVYPRNLLRSEWEKEYPDEEYIEYAKEPLDGPLPFTIIAKPGAEELKDFVKGRNTGITIIIPNSAADIISKANGQMLDMNIYFDVKGTDKASVSEYLESIDKQYEDVDVMNIGSSLTQIVNFKVIINRMVKIVMVVFLIFSSIICLLNVYSSVSGLMVSRRRSFAVMRSVGMTEKQIFKMSTLEGMMMLFRGIIVAVPVIVIMCYGIKKVFISEFGQFKMTLPLIVIMVYVLLIGVSEIIMTRVCCKKEMSSDIIGEIKKDGI